MCPICEGETLAQSDSPAAQRIKAEIQERIAAGDSRSEIKQRLVSGGGERILGAPPRHGFGPNAWVLALGGGPGRGGIPGVLAVGGAAARGAGAAAPAR